MDFSNRGNRPEQQQQQQQQQPAPQAQMKSPELQAPERKMRKFNGFDLGKFGSIVMLFGVAILAAALIFALVFGGKDTANSEADLINSDRYQAVFLDSPDGQVYFGKLAVYNDSTYILNDIFYVRVDTPIQPEGADQEAQPNISLAKLGNELHGPEDVMFVSRDKVLYWENLKDDGQVVTAITQFKANGEQVPAPTTQQSTQPTGTPQREDTNPTTAPLTP
jgi:hypothetical protein